MAVLPGTFVCRAICFGRQGRECTKTEAVCAKTKQMTAGASRKSHTISKNPCAFLPEPREKIRAKNYKFTVFLHLSRKLLKNRGRVSTIEQ